MLKWKCAAASNGQDKADQQEGPQTPWKLLKIDQRQHFDDETGFECCWKQNALRDMNVFFFVNSFFFCKYIPFLCNEKKKDINIEVIFHYHKENKSIKQRDLHL